MYHHRIASHHFFLNKDTHSLGPALSILIYMFNGLTVLFTFVYRLIGIPPLSISSRLTQKSFLDDYLCFVRSDDHVRLGAPIEGMALSRTQRAGLTPQEIEFMAMERQVEIVPFFSMKELKDLDRVRFSQAMIIVVLLNDDRVRVRKHTMDPSFLRKRGKHLYGWRFT